MVNRKRVKRITIPRAPALTYALADLADAVDEASNLSVMPPLQMSVIGGVGKTITFNGEWPLRLAKTTASLANGTVTTPTSAAGVFKTFDGTTLSDTTETCTIYNYHDKTVASGSLVLVVKWMNYWWFVDVYSCGVLS